MIHRSQHINQFLLRKVIVLLFICALVPNSFAQKNILQTKISINLNNINANAAMDSIAQKTDCYFTYNSNLFSDNKIVSVHKNNEKLESVLFSIIPDSLYTLEQINKHIIIIPKENQEEIKNEIKTQIKHKIISGIINSNNNPLPYANIGIKGKTKGTVSNLEGKFSLTLSENENKDTLVISYLGFENKEIPVKNLNDDFLKITLIRDFISLQEIVIRHNDPRLIVKSAVKKIKDNYPQTPYNTTSFYRESVLKNNKYMIYLESILNIYKKPSLGFTSNRVKLLKSRKIYDHSHLDTITFRLRGGVEGCLNIDIIKQQPTFLNPNFFKFYNYHLIDINSFDNKTVYVIEFTPIENLSEPLFMGKMLIETESLAIIQAEFSYPTKRLDEIKSQFVRKSSRKIKVKPVSIRYAVNYKKYNDKYYLNHSLGKLKFKVRSRKKLFYKTFETNFEMATNQISTENIIKYSYRESIPKSTVMSKEIFTYDSDFWGSKNFITPEKNIENALKRINQRMLEVALARYSDL